jgi:hypothetical protein
MLMSEKPQDNGTADKQAPKVYNLNGVSVEMHDDLPEQTITAIADLETGKVRQLVPDIQPLLMTDSQALHRRMTDTGSKSGLSDSKHAA